MDKYLIVSIVLAGLLVSAGVFLYNQNNLLQIQEENTNQLNSQLQELRNQNNQLQTSLNQLTLEHEELASNYEILTENSELLTQDLSKMSQEYQTLDTKYTILQSNLTKTIEQVEDYEANIKDAMAWFETNNDIQNVKDYKFLYEDIKDECVFSHPHYCQIKLACLTFVNEKKYLIYYKPDYSIVNKSDFLQDLVEIYSNRGGDCEDQSLLFTAEYNALVDYCESKGHSRDEIVLESYTKNEETEDYYFTSFDRNYYIPYAEEKIVTNGGNYMYPVCGRFLGQPVGHCVVAITKEPITGKENVYEQLQDAILVEPQGGYYMDHMADTDMIFLYPNGQEKISNYFISIVMLPEDILYYYRHTKKNEWVGYSDFLVTMNGYQNNLKALK